MKIDGDIWGDERRLRSLFSWLAKSGVGVRYGSRPIGWYQQHQSCAVDVLEDQARKTLGIAKGAPFEVKALPPTPAPWYHDIVMRRPGTKAWIPAGWSRGFFDLADRCARGDRAGAGLEGLRRRKRRR